VAGLAVRLLYLFALAPRTLPLGDALVFHLQANVLASGHGFLNPIQFVWFHQRVATAEHPPLFPLVLSLVSRAGGRSVLAHQVATCAIGAATVGVIGAAGRAAGGDRVGLLAAAVAAIDPTFWAADVTVMSETLFALAIALLLLLELRYFSRPTPGLAAAMGVVVGLAALTRGEGLVLLVLAVLPAILLAEAPSRRARVGAFALAAVAVSVVLAPWVVRNAITFDRPVLLSIDADTALAAANCHEAYHGALIGDWTMRCVAAVPIHGDESVQADELRSAAIHYAASHVDRLPLVVAAREARVWSLLHPFQDLPRQNRAISWLQLGWFYAIVPVALAGAVVLRRSGTPMAPFAGQFALVVATAALAYGNPRFRVPVDVVAVILAAAALDLLPRRSPPPVRTPTGPVEQVAAA
jgi:4-amino-4-deoxy-L-arabinose transferase-like glycosyltransferase